MNELLVLLARAIADQVRREAAHAEAVKARLRREKPKK